VNLIVPDLFPVFVRAKRVYLTSTVQDAPGIRLVPVQVSAAPATKLKVPGPAPLVTLTFVTAILDGLAVLFVSVAVPAMVRIPASNVMVSGLGVMVTVALFATPVPVKFTGVGVTVAPVYATVNVLGIEPVEVAGANTTPIVQVAPTPRFALQVPPAAPPGLE
jgi:hypothetical protein